MEAVVDRAATWVTQALVERCGSVKAHLHQGPLRMLAGDSKGCSWLACASRQSLWGFGPLGLWAFGAYGAYGFLGSEKTASEAAQPPTARNCPPCSWAICRSVCAPWVLCREIV